MLEKDFKSAVKSVLGTCASVGILVENEEPNDLVKEVAAGKYDKEINSQKTDTTTDKRQKLEDYFKDIKKAQDAKKELAEKAAKEAEEAKAAATAAAPAAAAATPAAGAAPAAAAKKEEKKPAAKKK